mgnify:CR=1 FL=1
MGLSEAELPLELRRLPSRERLASVVTDDAVDLLQQIGLAFLRDRET